MRRYPGGVTDRGEAQVIAALRAAGARFGFVHGSRADGEARPDSDLDAIKYRFITLIEGAARIAHHITVSEGWGAPDSNAAAFVQLGARQVLDRDRRTGWPPLPCPAPLRQHQT